MVQQKFKPGTVLHLGAAAGIQWRIRPITIRVVHEMDWPTSWDGTVYIDCYELGLHGDEVQRRTVYVIRSGVVEVPPPALSAVVTQPRTRRRADALAVRL